MIGRRGFLLGGAGAAGALSLAACSKVTLPKYVGLAQLAPADGKLAANGASLEQLAVTTYQSTLAAAQAARLGNVPAAITSFVTAAMADHQKALDTWNGARAFAGDPPVTDPPASLKATIDQMFAQVKDANGVAKIALLLEQAAADTYLAAIPTLQAKSAITLAAGFQVMAQEHAATLLFVLGQYPVPDTFQKMDHAFNG